MSMSDITMNVNGRTVTGSVEPRTHLADFLREDLLLTGTHLGCEQGRGALFVARTVPALPKVDNVGLAAFARGSVRIEHDVAVARIELAEMRRRDLDLVHVFDAPHLCL